MLNYINIRNVDKEIITTENFINIKTYINPTIIDDITIHYLKKIDDNQTREGGNDADDCFFGYFFLEKDTGHEGGQDQRTTLIQGIQNHRVQMSGRKGFEIRIGKQADSHTKDIFEYFLQIGFSGCTGSFASDRKRNT